METDIAFTLLKIVVDTKVKFRKKWLHARSVRREIIRIEIAVTCNNFQP